jgi:hypothetical protein
MGSFGRHAALTQQGFIEVLAKEKTKEKQAAAVFVVELSEEIDDETLELATQQLQDLVGPDRLTFFRVR